MKVPLISSRLTFRSPSMTQPPTSRRRKCWFYCAMGPHRLIRGLISPSHVLGFFVDNRVSIMSIHWFSALGSPSYLITVLHYYYCPAVDRSNFLYYLSPIMYQHSAFKTRTSERLVSMRMKTIICYGYVTCSDALLLSKGYCVR
jgi:hypothetical protein